MLDIEPNVFVYCCAKSGSSTLRATFNENGYNAIQCHSNIEFKKKYNATCSIFDVIENSMNKYEQIYIIDSYRTPIERKLSSFFQNNNCTDESIESILTKIQSNFYNMSFLCLSTAIAKNDFDLKNS